MIRKPAVAGSFYPGDKLSITSELQRCTSITGQKLPCIAAIAPHAGYIFSGEIAGALYSQIEIPSTVVILAPNHRGPLVPFAASPADSWLTPLGIVELDKDLAGRLALDFPSITVDAAPHAHEHSAEVQLPFLQFFRPDVKILPIVIAEHELEPLTQLGAALARAARGRSVLIVASSDMTHFENAELAKQQDDLALERILALDAPGLHETVLRHRISMCGFAPSVAMLTAAVELGAKTAELVRYGHSGQQTGDHSSVVAYAAVRIS